MLKQMQCANTDTYTVYFTLISYFAMIIFGQDAGLVGVLIIIEDEKGIALKIKVNILEKMFAFVLCWTVVPVCSSCYRDVERTFNCRVFVGRNDKDVVPDS